MKKEQRRRDFGRKEADAALSDEELEGVSGGESTDQLMQQFQQVLKQLQGKGQTR